MKRTPFACIGSAAQVGVIRKGIGPACYGACGGVEPAGSRVREDVQVTLRDRLVVGVQALVYNLYPIAHVDGDIAQALDGVVVVGGNGLEGDIIALAHQELAREEREVCRVHICEDILLKNVYELRQVRDAAEGDELARYAHEEVLLSLDAAYVRRNIS